MIHALMYFFCGIWYLLAHVFIATVSVNIGKEFEGKEDHIDKVKKYLNESDILPFLSNIYNIPHYCESLGESSLGKSSWVTEYM